MNLKKKWISRIGTNLSKNLKQCSATKARQQMLNRRLKHSDRARSILLIS